MPLCTSRSLWGSVSTYQPSNRPPRTAPLPLYSKMPGVGRTTPMYQAPPKRGIYNRSAASLRKLAHIILKASSIRTAGCVDIKGGLLCAFPLVECSRQPYFSVEHSAAVSLGKFSIVVKKSFFDVEGYKYFPLRVSYAQVLTFEFNPSQFYLRRTSASLSHRNRIRGGISVALPLKNLLSV